MNSAMMRNTGLTGSGAHAFSVWMSGVDIVDLIAMESIQITQSALFDEASRMSFRIEDPTQSLSTTYFTDNLGDGLEVLVWDHTNDIPLFGGWITDVTSFVDYAAAGASHDIAAVGYDACLDWSWVATHRTCLANASTGIEIQSVLGNWLVGPLTFLGGNSPTFSTAYTVEIQDTQSALAVDVDVSNMTVRAAIRSLVDASTGNTADPTAAFDPRLIFVDAFRQFWWAVTALSGGSSSNAFNYQTGANRVRAESITYTRTNAELEDVAYVAGGNAAGTGFVSGPATTRHYPPRTLGISDSSITTATARNQRAMGELVQRRTSWDFEGTTHTGPWLTGRASAITYPSIGLVVNTIITSVGISYPEGTAPVYHVRMVEYGSPDISTTSWVKKTLSSVLTDRYTGRVR